MKTHKSIQMQKMYKVMLAKAHHKPIGVVFTSKELIDSLPYCICSSTEQQEAGRMLACYMKKNAHKFGIVNPNRYPLQYYRIK
ncbi:MULTISPECIES: hypothetical protein [Staphylococcaceae]|uniref:hypothetical protein n=1 Tax=Staphylococcaceae TaxID=90964 RepID=UPI00105A9905|nr:MULTISPECIES: hypothetical protein [Macrococcus]TDL38273.1 hypothetical protein EVU91_05025 [Macrococcus bohemicus]UTH16283.1 hypothetical protein KFV12_00425 [Macrococcus epidermidis]